ncbi:MAG: N-6 DNA methylase [Trueperaceae bacterium]
MTAAEREKALLNELNEVKSRTGRRSWEVFSDWTEAMAIALANSTEVNPKVRAAREGQYAKLPEKLGAESMERFKTAYAHLVELYELEARDWLGHLYMTLELGNPDSGQYFTPPEISALAARLAFNPEIAKASVEERGYLTFHEPTSGAGGMLIEFTKIYKEAGFNPQTQLHATLVDIDITAVHMTYVQLSLMGIPAIVIHGDLLRLHEWSHWRTPFHTLGLWEYRLRAPKKYADAAPYPVPQPVQPALFEVTT